MTFLVGPPLAAALPPLPVALFPLLGIADLRASTTPYANPLIFLFLVLHEIGSHYTYALVPYDDWFRSMTGTGLNELFGFERNHFDRFTHFAYGLLLAYPPVEPGDTDPLFSAESLRALAAPLDIPPLEPDWTQVAHSGLPTNQPIRCTWLTSNSPIAEEVPATG